MVATKNTQWLIDDWKVDVAVMENLNVNIEKLVEDA